MAEHTKDRWRRNRLAMAICYEVMQLKGKDNKCGCYNGDERPDEVHFPHCACMVRAADAALESDYLKDDAALSKASGDQGGTPA